MNLKLLRLLMVIFAITVALFFYTCFYATPLISLFLRVMSPFIALFFVSFALIRTTKLKLIIFLAPVLIVLALFVDPIHSNAENLAVWLEYKVRFTEFKNTIEFNNTGQRDREWQAWNSNALVVRYFLYSKKFVKEGDFMDEKNGICYENTRKIDRNLYFVKIYIC